MDSSTLSFISNPKQRNGCKAFVTSISVDLTETKKEALINTVMILIDVITEKNQSGQNITINTKQNEFSLELTIINKGVPLFQDMRALVEEPEIADFAPKLDDIKLLNEGRAGQRFILKANIISQAEKSIAEEKNLKIETISSDEIVYREMKPGDERDLSKLFHRVYEYNYVNEDVYYPERILDKITLGDWISVVATLKSGKILGHVAIVRWSKTPLVYEAALGIVDPTIKSSGMFKNLFSKCMDIFEMSKASYCFFDCVTNHDFTQRFVAKFDVLDTALMVGCQSRDTQARLSKLGIGEDSVKMDRYSLLYGIKRGERHPFGNNILIPLNVGELIGETLQKLEINWFPAPRFYPLMEDGAFQESFNKEQRSMHFDLFSPGKHAIHDIINIWKEALRDGYHYASIDVPLESPGLGALYEYLAENGFFISGILPYNYSDKLCLRLQGLAPVRPAWNDIKLFSKDANRLFSVIKDDYKRNNIL